jgi:hypothetical protein
MMNVVSISLGVDQVKKSLIAVGFEELRENEAWQISPLGKVKELNCEARTDTIRCASISLRKMLRALRRSPWAENIALATASR